MQAASNDAVAIVRLPNTGSYFGAAAEQLDQERPAGAADRARTGVAAQQFKCRGAGPYGFAQPATRHAGAVAHRGGGRPCGNGAGLRRAEQQAGARKPPHLPGPDHGAVAYRLLDAADLRPSTDAERADEAAAAQHEAAIAPGGRILPDQRADIGALIELLDVSHAEDVGPDNLQLRGGDGAAIVRRYAGNAGGGNGGLLEPRRNQPVDVSVVLRTFADRIDRRIGRLHRIVDGDAVSDRDAGVARQLDVGTDAGADDRRVAGDGLAGRQHDALDPAGAGDGLDRTAGAHLEAHGADFFRQHLAGAAVDLARHQAVFVLDDDGLDVAKRHAARRFEAEQAAADHDGAARADAARDQLFNVVEIAEAEDARQFAAGDRRDVRARSEAEHQVRIAPSAGQTGSRRFWRRDRCGRLGDRCTA